ncbi:unnamed protein product [Ilex paraguariensis]|uniref:Uncharacterized protein n=1 Tax=Ilex paraguariensis TaxID=185542 RepID=A0ABC8S4X0_9AQUA
MASKESKEPYQDLVTENTVQDDLDEAEETLSLCDLPIYNDSARYEDFSEQHQNFSSSSSSPSDQDCFEFFSEDWIKGSSFSSEKIVFCGKIIPCKEPVSEDTHKKESNKEREEHKPGLFRWTSKSLNRSKPSESRKRVSNLRYVSSSKTLSSPVPEKYRYDTHKCSKKYDRWYLFMFGLAKFPAEMELRDMRSRKIRRKSWLFRTSGGGEKGFVGRRRMKGLWGLIRALGCGGLHHTTAVASSGPALNVSEYARIDCMTRSKLG